MQQMILYQLSENVGSWTIRIHSPHGDKDYHRRHIHISKKKLDGVYSWNEDGTRHDKHKFPNHAQFIEKAMKLASNRLKIPKGTLQLITISYGKINYSINSVDKFNNDLFKTYIHQNKVLIILISESTLISIILTLDIKGNQK